LELFGGGFHGQDRNSFKKHGRCELIKSNLPRFRFRGACAIRSAPTVSIDVSPKPCDGEAIPPRPQASDWTYVNPHSRCQIHL
jgi:hypothetical protein